MRSRYHAALDSRRWQHVRKLALDRDGYRCRKCGKAGRLEVDHVRPMERGGQPYQFGNLQTLCRGCHIDKTRGERARPIPGQLAWRQALKLP